MLTISFFPKFKMNKLLIILRKLKPETSWKYLLFILFIIIGCSYQVIQVTKVYFEFETTVDVSFNPRSEIAIPIVSFCKYTVKSFINDSSFVRLMSLPAKQIYNETFGFGHVFLQITFIGLTKDNKRIRFIYKERVAV